MGVRTGQKTGFADHLEQHDVRRRLIGQARHLNGERIRVQQHARFERIEDQTCGSRLSTFGQQTAFSPLCFGFLETPTGTRNQI